MQQINILRDYAFNVRGDLEKTELALNAMNNTLKTTNADLSNLNSTSYQLMNDLSQAQSKLQHVHFDMKSSIRLQTSIIPYFYILSAIDLTLCYVSLEMSVSYCNYRYIS